MSTRTSQKDIVMKNLWLLAIAIITFTVGCAGPRTGSVGYRNTQPILTTNRVGNITMKSVEGKPSETTQTENYTVTFTPPVPERTWKEKFLGQRPPGATSPSVMPPFPASTSSGGAPTVVATAATQPAVRQQSPVQHNLGVGSQQYRDSINQWGRPALGQWNPRAEPSARPQQQIPAFRRESLGEANPRAR